MQARSLRESNIPVFYLDSGKEHSGIDERSRDRFNQLNDESLRETNINVIENFMDLEAAKVTGPLVAIESGEFCKAYDCFFLGGY